MELEFDENSVPEDEDNEIGGLCLSQQLSSENAMSPNKPFRNPDFYNRVE